jgi:hypothetical protein
MSFILVLPLYDSAKGSKVGVSCVKKRCWFWTLKSRSMTRDASEEAGGKYFSHQYISRCFPHHKKLLRNLVFLQKMPFPTDEICHMGLFTVSALFNHSIIYSRFV